MDEARIENWGITRRMTFEGLETSRLTGNIYGHERFKDGSSVTTSTIMDWDKEGGKVTTRNTVYVLGEMARDFVEFMEKMGYTLDMYIEAIKNNRKVDVFMGSEK